MSELFDILDENGDVIDVRSREEAHRDGLWHRALHCWIVAHRDGKDLLIFQLRSADKDLYPDMLDISAAGHLQTGETTADGLRELEEELGVIVDQQHVQFLGTRVEAVKTDTMINKEFCETFILRDDRPLTAYKLQEEEVNGLVEVELDAALRLFAGEVGAIEVQSVRVENGTFTESKRAISMEDLVYRRDNYYISIAINAQRFLAGEQYLGI